MIFRLARFLRRWSAPEGSTGPLIASVYGDSFAYIAVRVRLSRHKVAWLRVVKRAGKRARFEFSGLLDLRGHKCECGSGIWIQNDVDGCRAPGCFEYFTSGPDGGELEAPGRYRFVESRP